MLPQYDVFLSYSRKDSEVMQRVYQTLQEEGLQVWMDANLLDLEPTKPEWKDAIERGIESARSVVVILSPDAKQSEWVKRELDYAHAQRKPIFPVLARGTQQDAVPFLLVSHQRAENHDGETKMMVDLLTLITNGLDLPPTPLIRKFQERQQQLESEQAAQRKTRDADEIERLVQKEVAERLRSIEHDKERQAAIRALGKLFGFSRFASKYNPQKVVSPSQTAFMYHRYRWIARLSLVLVGLGLLLFKIAYDSPLGFGYMQGPAIVFFVIAALCWVWLLWLGRFPMVVGKYNGKLKFLIREKDVVLTVIGHEAEIRLRKKTQRRIRELHGMKGQFPFDTKATHRVYYARKPDGTEYLLSVEPLPSENF